MDDFILSADPNDTIVFSGKNLGEEPANATLKITNPTKDRQILKVKCTSNEMFRIKPPVFALNPGEEEIVNLSYNAGNTVPDCGKHYFVIYYIKSEDDTKSPRECWASHTGDPDGLRRLYVYFKRDGTEKEEGKSEDDREEGKDNEKKEEENKEEKKVEKKEDAKEDGNKENVKPEEKEEKKEETKEVVNKEDIKPEEKKEEKKEEAKEVVNNEDIKPEGKKEDGNVEGKKEESKEEKKEAPKEESKPEEKEGSK